MLAYSNRMGQLEDAEGKSARIAQGKPKERKEDNMTKRTKTWKIGERCAGGVITAKATENSAKIEIKEWVTGEVIASNTFGRVHIGASIENWLFEFTTPYRAGKVREWIGNVWATSPKLSAPVVITARLA